MKNRQLNIQQYEYLAWATQLIFIINLTTIV